MEIYILLKKRNKHIPDNAEGLSFVTGSGEDVRLEDL